MESLFDQLKSEPAVNMNIVEPLGNENKCEAANFSDQSHSPVICAAVLPMTNKTKQQATKLLENPTTARRDSMPTAVTTGSIKNISKSRSLSPPKGIFVKPFKVLLERTKFDEMTELKKINTSAHDGNSGSKVNKIAKIPHKSSSQDNPPTVSTKNGEKTPKKATPTKAQQKLFDPAVLVKAQQLTQLKVKRCKVHLLRQDLMKLQREFRAKKKVEKVNKTSKNQSYPEHQSKKRSSESALSPSEKSLLPKRIRTSDAKESKQASGFFIKLNALTKPIKSKTNDRKSTRDNLKDNKLSRKFSSGSIAKKLNAAAAFSSIKPTKFTRSQLIKMYGKRVFSSRVKIERCAHPMMLIFESNARARRLQAKRSKSKNLSVSFREQVEIFGDSSDSDEIDISHIVDIDAASTSQAALKSANPTPPSTATPARLKKVENGKVVDDIELDPSLFVMPVVASTPYISQSRKKREKKSFSPLKGDGTPSPRKEQLKLANEKMPPSGLRRLTTDEVDEEDDEDDECEYIVPIEIPERRISRINSANALDDVPLITEDIGAASTPTEMAVVPPSETPAHISTDESFTSAIEELTAPEKLTSYESSGGKVNLSVENITNGGCANSTINEGEREGVVKIDAEQRTDTGDPVNADLTKLTRIGSISPSQSLNSLNDLVDSLINNVNDGRSTAISETAAGTDATAKTNIKIDSDTNEINVPKVLSMNELKLRDTLDDNMSLQLFADDDNIGPNAHFLEDSAIKGSEIVDGIVQERIEEISKEKQLDSPSQDSSHFLNSKVTAE